MPATTLQRITETVDAITELVESYRLAGDHNELKDELVSEIEDHALNALCWLKDTNDILGTAYTHLARAIDLPQCGGCKFEE
ncbi:MAG: hypothetical protein JRG71_13290 [Deltaproteobacteria bacterium]|nr:hypothetical protein [Deltaproteobacteria bacterium]